MQMIKKSVICLLYLYLFKKLKLFYHSRIKKTLLKQNC